jgi:hypothetical protein
MQWRILSAQGLRIVLAVLVVTIMAQRAAFAENGRDFSASYDLKDVSPVAANQVSVTLSLRLQNHSGADVADAEVSLQDIVQESSALGVFPMHLSLMNHAVAKLSGAFIVPTRYVTQWRTGQGPRIVVRVVSDTGHAIRRPVELLYMPGVGR